ncbi:DUF58 domain-containing protein [Leifsonia kafniensis]|uniref:DUF58 domain-containing protein n=1 Tax=Leifsonia kafniensis TaxID=475957 RepID=A0ABP7KAW0_9MICO
MSPRRRPAVPVWFPRLTLRGRIFLIVGAAVLAVAILLAREDLLFIGSALIVVPVVAAVAVGAQPVRVQVARAFRPPVVGAGYPVTVSVRVQNLSTGPLSGIHWTELTSAGLIGPESAVLPGLRGVLGGGPLRPQAVTVDYTLIPDERGVYDIGPLVLTRFDPFGLAFCRRISGSAHDLVVTPHVSWLPGTGLSVVGGDGANHELQRHHNPHADELIAREYRPGDPMRRVNWPATARRGEIMVRQEEQRSNPSVRLVLDTTESSASATSSKGFELMNPADAAFELGIELLASIGVHLLEAGYRLEVIELGPSQLTPDGPGTDATSRRGDVPATYTGLQGDRGLLEGLAGIVPVAASGHDAPAAARRTESSADRGVEPTFAILSAVDNQDVHTLDTLRAHADPAIAFVLDTVAEEMVDRLADSGWRCLAVHSEADFARAWEQAMSVRRVEK